MQRRETLGLTPGDTDPFFDSIDIAAADEVASTLFTFLCASAKMTSSSTWDAQSRTTQDHDPKEYDERRQSLCRVVQGAARDCQSLTSNNSDLACRSLPARRQVNLQSTC